MDIVVNDASILIDLIELDLTEKFFDLNFIFYSTDLIINEIKSPNNKDLLKKIELNVLKIHKSNEDEQKRIEELSKNHPGLSLADCSGLFLSEIKSAILLTGDKALTKAGRSLGIEIHGTLWILTQLVDAGIIDSDPAINKLEDLKKINPRVPESEINKLISKWSE